MPIDPADTDGFLGPIRELRASLRIEAGRVDAVGALLVGGEYRSPDELVSATGTSRRTVDALLRAAGPLLESADGRVRFSLSSAAAAAAEFGGGPGVPAPDPWEMLATGDPEMVTAAAALVAGAPHPVPELDHVPATPVTVLKRGHYLRSTFDLRQARVLFVGDHDLTSLGLFLAGGAPGLKASVVDVAEPLLEYIDTEARKRGYDIRCHFADLRLGLPGALREAADAAFTDPPYTPEGVRLFVTRGLQGMANRRTGRVLVAYGYGEQPALGLAVQEAVSPLHLTYEAVLPGFNRYDGARASGSRAALYVLC
ncbi:MAG TPA: bis-aminopropyl spermidine synthase family protein, partial [Streptosporangiaceae bacterium]